jgi:hypothetical protein
MDDRERLASPSIPSWSSGSLAGSARAMGPTDWRGWPPNSGRKLACAISSIGFPTTRVGTPCQKAAATGKKRCRLHGGGKGSGAPPGERNGNYRHGLRTREAIAERRALRA